MPPVFEEPPLDIPGIDQYLTSPRKLHNVRVTSSATNEPFAIDVHATYTDPDARQEIPIALYWESPVDDTSDSTPRYVQLGDQNLRLENELLTSDHFGIDGESPAGIAAMTAISELNDAYREATRIQEAYFEVFGDHILAQLDSLTKEDFQLEPGSLEAYEGYRYSIPENDQVDARPFVTNVWLTRDMSVAGHRFDITATYNNPEDDHGNGTILGFHWRQIAPGVEPVLVARVGDKETIYPADHGPLDIEALGLAVMGGSLLRDIPIALNQLRREYAETISTYGENMVTANTLVVVALNAAAHARTRPA